MSWVKEVGDNAAPIPRDLDILFLDIPGPFQFPVCSMQHILRKSPKRRSPWVPEGFFPEVGKLGGLGAAPRSWRHVLKIMHEYFVYRDFTRHRTMYNISSASLAMPAGAHGEVWGGIMVQGGYPTFIPISYRGRHLAIQRLFASRYNRPLHHRRLQSCFVCLFRTLPSAFSAMTHYESSGSGLLNAKFTFKGTSQPIILARIDRPINALQLCRWQFSRNETL